jgi:Tfp pilus assembly PilM family ATPase
MFNFNFKYPIGIDIGAQHIYAAQLKQIRQGFAVRGLMHQEFDGEAGGVPAKSDVLAPLLKNIVKSKQFAGKRAVLHIPHQNIVSFPIRFQVGKSTS